MHLHQPKEFAAHFPPAAVCFTLTLLLLASAPVAAASGPAATALAWRLVLTLASTCPCLEGQQGHSLAAATRFPAVPACSGDRRHEGSGAQPQTVGIKRRETPPSQQRRTGHRIWTRSDGLTFSGNRPA